MVRSPPSPPEQTPSPDRGGCPGHFIQPDQIRGRVDSGGAQQLSQLADEAIGLGLSRRGVPPMSWMTLAAAVVRKGRHPVDGRQRRLAPRGDADPVAAGQRGCRSLAPAEPSPAMMSRSVPSTSTTTASANPNRFSKDLLDVRCGHPVPRPTRFHTMPNSATLSSNRDTRRLDEIRLSAMSTLPNTRARRTSAPPGDQPELTVGGGAGEAARRSHVVKALKQVGCCYLSSSVLSVRFCEYRCICASAIRAIGSNSRSPASPRRRSGGSARSCRW